MNRYVNYGKAALLSIGLWTGAVVMAYAQPIISRASAERPDPNTLPRGTHAAPDNLGAQLQAMREAAQAAQPSPTTPPLSAAEVVIPTAPPERPVFTDPKTGKVRIPAPVKDAPITANAKPRPNQGKAPTEMDVALAARARNDPCLNLPNDEERTHCGRMNQAAPPKVNCVVTGMPGFQAQCERQVAAIMACRGSRSAAELQTCNQSQRALLSR